MYVFLYIVSVRSYALVREVSSLQGHWNISWGPCEAETARTKTRLQPMVAPVRWRRSVR